VVLIGGGIGITPMLSMLDWALAEQPGREVWLFYGVRNGREMIMKSRLESLAAAHPNFHLRICFSDPKAEDVAVRDYQHRSRVDVHVLRMQLPLKPYHFYICGPTPMMESPGARAGGLGRAGFTHPFRGLRSGLHQAPRRGAGTGIRRDGQRESR
jgi:ferredoxin-NADP reductase